MIQSIQVAKKKKKTKVKNSQIKLNKFPLFKKKKKKVCVIHLLITKAIFGLPLTRRKASQKQSNLGSKLLNRKLACLQSSV